MELVLATELLDGPGGSETYLVTVAEHLVRLGHRVTAYARRWGPLAERAREVGAEVVRTDALPERCDGVLVQDVGMAYELAARWPELPQLVVAHSPLFDVQLPPLLPVPGSLVVVLNDRVGRRVEAMPLDLEVVRLRQPIDTLRFTPQGPAHPVPRRVLLLGNYLHDASLDRLATLWRDAGLEVTQVGVATATTRDAAAQIAGHDVVVGKGRAVLEAMACGRPAFVYDAFGCDGWVTAAGYAAMEAEGFAGQTEASALDDAGLLRALERYDAGMGRVNRDLVLKNHQARGHVEALVGLFERLRFLAATETAPTPPSVSAELARLSRLRWAAENENWGLRRQVEQLSAEVWQLRVERDQLDERFAAEQADRVELETARAELERRLAQVRRRAHRQRLARRAAEEQLAGGGGETA